MARTGQAENSAANQQLQQQQANAYQLSNNAIGKYNSDLATLQSGNNIAADPFATPTYLANENLEYTTTANATANAGKEDIANTALRTGDNSASYLSAIQNNQRRAQQSANTGLNQQHSQDYLNNIGYQQAMLNADLAPTGASDALYGTSTSGRTAALNNLTQFGLASYQPWSSAIAAAGAAAGGALGNPNWFGSKG